MVATTNKKVRFANNNQVSELDLANITYSSQLASFPFTNTRSEARFRVWKPAGNFTIKATNNLIYINDGADKTVTIPVGNYTYSTLAAEIETQLNSVSTNFSSSYSLLTRKFLIERTSSFTLRQTQIANSAWDVLGYTSGLDGSATQFFSDESRNHTSEFVVYDLGSAKAVDFFALSGLLSENLTISSSATVTLKGSNIDDFTTPAVTINITRTESGMFHFEDNLDMTYRFWEVEIIDRLNTLGPEGFNISNIYLGDYETLNSTNIANGLAKNLIDGTTTRKSDAGSKFFRKKTKYWSFSSAKIQNLSDSERVAMQEIYNSVGISEPFYISIDPTLSVSSSIDELTKLVQFDGRVAFNHMIRDIWTMTFSMSEVI